MYVSMNPLHRHLHSPLRRHKYDVVKFIIQATGLSTIDRWHYSWKIKFLHLRFFRREQCFKRNSIFEPWWPFRGFAVQFFFGFNIIFADDSQNRFLSLRFWWNENTKKAPALILNSMSPWSGTPPLSPRNLVTIWPLTIYDLHSMKGALFEGRPNMKGH